MMIFLLDNNIMDELEKVPNFVKKLALLVIEDKIRFVQSDFDWPTHKATQNKNSNRYNKVAGISNLKIANVSIDTNRIREICKKVTFTDVSDLIAPVDKNNISNIKASRKKVSTKKIQYLYATAKLSNATIVSNTNLTFIMNPPVSWMSLSEFKGFIEKEFNGDKNNKSVSINILHGIYNCFNKENIQPIVKELQLNVDAAYLAEILNQVVMAPAAICRNQQKFAPTLADKRKLFKEIEKNAGKLIENVETFINYGPSAASFCSNNFCQKCISNDEISGFLKSLVKLKSDLDYLQQKAKVALSSLKTCPSKKLGDTSTLPIHTIIAKLAHIFENIIDVKIDCIRFEKGDKEGFKGKFFNFVKMIKDIIERNTNTPPNQFGRLPETDIGLGYMIRRVLKKVKTQKSQQIK